MPLVPGHRLGSYEIVAPLGAGGMGEVYRARDTRLGRDVAIKALPDAFARDPDRLARFEREAKLLASLNHPNIGAIYGLEVVDGHRYLVLEFIEGETLAEVLARTALPVGEAIEICAHVAGALESAHESSVVHRDLKPANVMLTPAGTVKVVDFGLAKSDAMRAGDSDPALSASPTMTYGATQAGMVLGTAAYMSPEQARGKAVDKRTDIWSFGCVLYECLAGRQAFLGETVSDLIAHILTSEPDWTALPAATPPRVRELLRRCLEKDARRRLRDIGDARIDLEETLAPRGSSSMAVPVSIAEAVDLAAARPKKRRFGLVIGAAILGALAAVVATRLVEPLLGPRERERMPVRFQIVESDTMLISSDGAHIALSPDGTMLAFVAGDSLSSQLWLRPLSSLAARRLAGTAGALMPFWSPDGRYIAFFTDNRLKRVPVAGGEVEDVTEVKRARGGSWNRRDEIVFAPTSDGPLFIIPAGGGEARQVTTPDSARGEIGHRFPAFLRDGRHFVFAALPPRDGLYTIRVGSIDGGRADSVAALPSGVAYAAPGWLLHQSGLSLMAVRFDARSRKVLGAPLNLREWVHPTNLSGGPGVTASGSMLAFRQFVPSSSRLAWYDADGHPVAALPFEVAQYLGDLKISPDGRSVVVSRSQGANPPEIWLGDLERGVMNRFASEPILNEAPRWSPDGTRIAYQNSQGGPQHFVVRPVRSRQAARSYLEEDPAFKAIGDFSPDGNSLMFSRQAGATRWDLYVLDLVTGKARPYLEGPYSEQAGSISPDGKWVAYTSDETGRLEVFVDSYPTPGSRFQVTTSGGERPIWLRDGSHLSFGIPSSPFEQQVADILPGEEFRVGPMRTLMRLPKTIEGWDRASDGRVLLQIPAGRPQVTAITVVLDWAGALRAR